jgi:DNA-binding Lrp family transcriptional regulator
MFRVRDGRRIHPNLPKADPARRRDRLATLRLSSGTRSHPMAVSAYILIQTEVGKASGVVAAVREVAGVVQADDVTGPYDVILRAEATSIDELGRMVVSQIQLVDGITRTLTCPVVHL